MRAVSGDKTAFAYSDDIYAAALLGAAPPVRTIAAAGQTRLVKVGTKGRSPPSARLYAPMDPIASLNSTRKVGLLEKIKQLTKQDPRIIQVMAGLAGEYDVVMVARVDGVIAADVRPLMRLSRTVIAGQTMSPWAARYRRRGGGGRLASATSRMR